MNSDKYRNMMSNHDNMVQGVPAGPFEKMAWSGDNALGNVVDYAPDAQNRQSILKLDEWGPPEMWTISLGIDRPTPDYTYDGGWFEVKALISVGSGGSTQLIEVDWINGVQLSVPMNAVNVTAVYEFPRGIPDLNMLAGLRLSVQIGRGTSASKYAPTRTIYMPDMQTFFASPAHAAYTQGYYAVRLPPFTREVEIIRPSSTTNPFAYYTVPGVGKNCTLLFGDVVGAGQNEYGVPYEDTLNSIIRRVTSSSITADQQRLTLPKGCRALCVFEETDTAGTYHTGDFWLNCHLGV